MSERMPSPDSPDTSAPRPGTEAARSRADGPDAAHTRPPGLDDATVEALGKLSEALEVVEQARGFLYGFHRLTGKADLALGEAVDLLREAGHVDLADDLERDLVGRNVIEGRWTFQIVEDFDDTYWSAFRAAEQDARDRLAGGRRHLFEAEMKEDRRTHGRRDHEAR
jgi:hypothetical protein